VLAPLVNRDGEHGAIARVADRLDVMREALGNWTVRTSDATSSPSRRAVQDGTDRPSRTLAYPLTTADSSSRLAISHQPNTRRTTTAKPASAEAPRARPTSVRELDAVQKRPIPPSMAAARQELVSGQSENWSVQAPFILPQPGSPTRRRSGSNATCVAITRIAANRLDYLAISRLR
jgi:hypothetical protein